MDELNAILKAWRELDGMEREAVLATVVHVAGSAYRRPGARMLIVPGGERIGCVSGGCLEGEITKRAWWFTGAGVPVVRVYDTSSDDDAVWEFGLGCNGVVQVMLERADAFRTREMLDFLDVHQRSRKPAVLATVVRVTGAQRAGRCGDRLLVNQGGVWGGALADTGSLAEVLSYARTALQNQKSRYVCCGGMEVFVEWIGPPLSLFLFGAGHDAIPVAAIAKQVGWSVTVLDGRPEYASARRFPGADRVCLIQPRDPLRDLQIESSAVVLMTHNYPLDLRLLPAIMARRPRYLGLLGPRNRADRLFADAGIKIPAYAHAPVGLDIGGDNPAAIALSIVAEIQAAIDGRAGGMLRHRSEPIHAPVDELQLAPPIPIADRARPAFCESRVGCDV